MTLRAEYEIRVVVEIDEQTGTIIDVRANTEEFNSSLPVDVLSDDGELDVSDPLFKYATAIANAVMTRGDTHVRYDVDDGTLAEAHRLHDPEGRLELALDLLRKLRDGTLEDREWNDVAELLGEPVE